MEQTLTTTHITGYIDSFPAIVQMEDGHRVKILSVKLTSIDMEYHISDCETRYEHHDVWHFDIELETACGCCDRGSWVDSFTASSVDDDNSVAAFDEFPDVQMSY